jgi:ankyrin repeat protein
VARLLLLELGVSQGGTDDCTTPLFIAAQKGHTEVVRVLLEKGAAVNQARTDDGTTPLFIAAQEWHVEAIQLLAVFGVNTTTGTTDGNWTPRSMAASGGHVALAKWLTAVETWMLLLHGEEHHTATCTPICIVLFKRKSKKRSSAAKSLCRLATVGTKLARHLGAAAATAHRRTHCPFDPSQPFVHHSFKC